MIWANLALIVVAGIGGSAAICAFFGTKISNMVLRYDAERKAKKAEQEANA